MDRASLIRKDLVKNFPSSYTYSGLTLHFTSEYKRALGCDPPKETNNTLVYTFSKLWKKKKERKKKKHFLKSALCANWLEKEVATYESTWDENLVSSPETVIP
jgi:hypothetical protein